MFGWAVAASSGLGGECSVYKHIGPQLDLKCSRLGWGAGNLAWVYDQEFCAFNNTSAVYLDTIVSPFELAVAFSKGLCAEFNVPSTTLALSWLVSGALVG